MCAQIRLRPPLFAFDSSTLYKESSETKLIQPEIFNPSQRIAFQYYVLLLCGLLICFVCRFFTTHSLGRHYHTLSCDSVLRSAYKQQYNIIKMKMQILFTVLR